MAKLYACITDCRFWWLGLVGAACVIGGFWLLSHIFILQTKPMRQETDSGFQFVVPIETQKHSPASAPAKFEVGSVDVAESVEIGAVQVVDAKQDQIETHTLWVRALSQPGKAAIETRAFEIPEGWQLVSADIKEQQGRARILKREGYVVLEVHALAQSPNDRALGFAHAEIIIQPTSLTAN